MEPLRNEIIESQKARTDLMKWKFILVSGLGAAGLGFTEKPGDPIFENVKVFVLCCIPFVCVYVDLLCRHLFLRILVIGKFIQIHAWGKDDYLQKYEEFTGNSRRMAKIFSAYALENIALPFSSFFLSFAIFYFSFKITDTTKSQYLMYSGIIGMALIAVIELFYRIQRFLIKEEKMMKNSSKQ